MSHTATVKSPVTTRVPIAMEISGTSPLTYTAARPCRIRGVNLTGSLNSAGAAFGGVYVIKNRTSTDPLITTGFSQITLAGFQLDVPAGGYQTNTQHVSLDLPLATGESFSLVNTTSAGTIRSDCVVVIEI